MTSGISSCKLFPDWLKTFLTMESSGIDAETFGDYIESILKDDSLDQQEISDYIIEFLEEVMPRDKAKECTKAIICRYHSTLENGGTTINAAATASSPASSKHLDELEAEMRHLVVQTKSTKTLNKQRQEAERKRKERDACTAAALREAGVSGYQIDEAAEAALTVALADSEYFARQNITCSPFQAEGKSGSGKGRGRGKSGKDVKEANGADADDEIDLSEIEEIQGYGKKEGVKPGSVLDALSTLDPSKFAGSSSVAPVTTTTGAGGPGGLRKVKRLPTPGDVSSSSTPGYLLLHSRGGNVASGLVDSTDADIAAEAANSGHTKTVTGKGGGRQVPRRMAEVGARAEEKHAREVARRRAKLGGIVAGNRLDDMDAFFFFSDDDDGNGKKSVSVKTSDPAETKQPRVTSGREYLEKQARDQQQQQQPTKDVDKTGAAGSQKKNERRRH